SCQFVAVTLIFSFVDSHWKKHPGSWDPRNLNKLFHPAFSVQGEPEPDSQGARVSRFDSVAQIVALCIALVWLRVAQGAPFLICGRVAAFLRPGPVLHHFYWPVFAIAALGILQAFINLIRPDWLRVMVPYRATTAAAWSVILFFVIRAGNWVVLASDTNQNEG